MHPSLAVQRNPPVIIETPQKQNLGPPVHAFSEHLLGDMPSFELDFGDEFKQGYVQICNILKFKLSSRLLIDQFLLSFLLNLYL
jgi:hypothetical protein